MRHPLDRPRTATPSRAPRYLKMQRVSRLFDPLRKLPRNEPAAPRLEQFLRLLRRPA